MDVCFLYISQLCAGARAAVTLGVRIQYEEWQNKLFKCLTVMILS